MTSLTKTFLALMAVTVVVAGTLVMLPGTSPASAPPQLTAAQMAELQPRPSQPAATTPTKSTDFDVPPPPEERDLEDGNGS